MTPIDLLRELRRRDISVSIDHDELDVSAPKGALSAELRQQLAEHKSDLVKLLSNISERRERIPVLERGLGDDQEFIASFAQQRLWFLDQLHGGSVEYLMPQALRLRGALDEKALERAIRAIVARHESLRTHFVEVDGVPIQVVAPFGMFPLPVEDLSGLSAAAKEEAVAETLRRERQTPFLLSQGPLVRVTLFRLGPQEHVLAYTFHHIVSDGWSVGVFNRELSALYGTFCAGEDSRLEPLSIQYADYAHWQRRQMEGEAGQRLLDYWTGKLAGAPPLLELPTDTPRAAHRNQRGESRTLQLPSELSHSLSALCRREGVTLFMGLLVSFKLLLARLSLQEDIVVGTPMAGRNEVAVENLIGFFINTLVLRSDLSGNPGFTEVLKRVRATALEDFEHQDLPFEKLIEKLQPERDLTYTPLFQIFFNMINLQESPLALVGLEVEPIGGSEPDAKFDLTLYAMELSGGIFFRAVYNAELFRGDTIERMLQQLQFLLEQIVTHPQQRIQNYSLRSAQAKQLLPDPEITLSEPTGIPVFRQFLDVAQASPANVAVRHECHDWTYRQLEEAAIRIAQQLIADGVQAGDVVVVSGRRSFGLVAGVLGVLGARGVILLMDPSLPLARRELMLQEASGKHWVQVDTNHDETWSDAFRRLPTTAISPADVCLDPSREGIGEAVDLVDSAPIDPAYIFFTSGTTGKPKAIVGSHKGLSHFMDWERQILGVLPNDRVAQLTHLSFDVVLRDIFLPLTSAATLSLPGEEMVTQGDQLIPWLRREGITILHAVPSLARAWLDNLPSETEVPTLRWVLFAGEPLTDRLIAQWRKQIGDSGEIMNLYGPTETTLAKCFHIVPRTPDAGIQPIGQSLPFAQALVLNHGNQLCGIGEPGEIAIRTPFRSLGYLNGSDQDRGRFLPNPFRNDPSDLIYRTGDRGVYTHDGTLRILGRSDDQIKIRGARVEPGEISAVLADHGGIRQSVVIAGEDASGETCLVAYLVPVKLRLALEAMELRDYLKKKLPDYMIPSRFVVISGLPLTANGKVDRKALEKLDGEELAGGADYVAPRNERECTLVEIWQTLLGREPIGIHDNFFDLGGHSLLAVRFLSILRQRTGVDLPIRMLFESPTPAALAERISIENSRGTSREAAASGPGPSLNPETTQIAPHSRLSEIDEILGKQRDYVRTWKGARFAPESFIVTLNESGKRQGLFWCLQGYRELTQLASYLGSDQPVHGMRSGHLIMNYTRETVDAIASHYVAEMIALQPTGPFLLAGNCQGGTIARAIAQQVLQLGRAVSLLILMEQGSFPPYDGSVALIFGRDSHFYPYKPESDPEAVFRSSYPEGYTVDIIAGAHGEFFESPNVETLATALKRRLPNPS